MQKKRSIKIISVVLILVLICISITYFKNDSKVVLATTREFNSENLQDNEHMHIEIDSSGDKVPVPNGYVGSKATGENEIDTGYVIYEGTEEVNDDNVEKAQKTRNQYVWIPVPDVSQMYGTDENGKKWGKLYEFTTDTGAGIDPVTGAKPLNWSESDGVMKIVNMTSYREPDIESSDAKFTLKEFDKSKLGFMNQLEQEFNRMIESVKKYGGFYIGRYETGNLSKEDALIQKDNEDIAGQTWYTMYKKCKKLKNESINIETGMIWGCQWDRTLMWLIETKNKTKKEICVDSSSWGNNLNSEFEYSSNSGKIMIKKSGNKVKIPTGSTEYTKANNIYDLAGNVLDRTVECINSCRISRGGVYVYDGNSTYNAAYRHPYTPTTSAMTSDGCRAMLYIK